MSAEARRPTRWSAKPATTSSTPSSTTTAASTTSSGDRARIASRRRTASPATSAPPAQASTPARSTRAIRSRPASPKHGYRVPTLEAGTRAAVRQTARVISAKLRHPVARLRGVTRLIHRFHGERVRSARRGVDEVIVDAGRDGKRAEIAVDVDLVLDQGLRIGVVGGLRPPDEELRTTKTTDDAHV